MRPRIWPPAELLEKKRHVRPLALALKGAHPMLIHRAVLRTALAADDHPVDSTSPLTWRVPQGRMAGPLQDVDPEEVVAARLTMALRG
jgi:hypothetical protein